MMSTIEVMFILLAVGFFMGWAILLTATTDGVDLDRLLDELFGDEEYVKIVITRNGYNVFVLSKEELLLFLKVCFIKKGTLYEKLSRCQQTFRTEKIGPMLWVKPELLNKEYLILCRVCQDTEAAKNTMLNAYRNSKT